jgi:hypothetical protein
VHSDDCGLSACGYISEAVTTGLYNLDDLRRINAQGDAVAGASASTAMSASKRAEFLRRFDNFGQTVFLDLDSGPPLVSIGDFRDNVLLQIPAHQYTQAERNAIQARIEADYQRFPTIRFTQTKLAADRSFTTLTFACNGGQPGPACDRIDPRDRQQPVDLVWSSRERRLLECRHPRQCLHPRRARRVHRSHRRFQFLQQCA